MGTWALYASIAQYRMCKAGRIKEGNSVKETAELSQIIRSALTSLMERDYLHREYFGRLPTVNTLDLFKYLRVYNFIALCTRTRIDTYRYLHLFAAPRRATTMLTSSNLRSTYPAPVLRYTHGLLGRSLSLFTFPHTPAHVLHARAPSVPALLPARATRPDHGILCDCTRHTHCLVGLHPPPLLCRRATLPEAPHEPHFWHTHY